MKVEEAKIAAATAAAKSLQLCPILCDPIDGLEWLVISFSNVWKWKVKVKSLSRVRLLAIAWTAAYQAPPSMGFSRKDYWSGVPLPSPKQRLGATNLNFRNQNPGIISLSIKCCLAVRPNRTYWLYVKGNLQQFPPQ